MDLLPPPGRLTVDVGCGEGRVARHLKEMGHRVVAIEASPALAAAARESDPDLEVHLADAARMPLGDATADLAVASMMLMNVSDLDGVLRETARVLAPGGRLCLSVVHPLNSHHDAGPGTSYFDVTSYADAVGHGDPAMTLPDTHRPLASYFRALELAGFVVERLREPIPDAQHVTRHPDAARWLQRPAFLHLRAERRG